MLLLKHPSCILIFTLSFACVNQAIGNNKDIIFAFDLHGVLLIAQPFRMVWSVTQQLVNTWWTDNNNTKAVIRTLWEYSNDLNGEVAFQIALQSGDIQLAQWICDLANMQSINYPCAAIVKELYQYGYTLIIASNIGASIIKDLANATKYSEHWHCIFQYFDLDQTCCTHFNPQIQHVEDVIKKPNTDYFYDYVLQNGTRDPQTIVFIDNNKANIKGACQAGIQQTITFTSAKQLRAALVKHGYLSTSKNPCFA